MSASSLEILSALARPHDPTAVRWRVGQTVKSQGEAPPSHGRALAYIDARDCERRLDEVMGVNWKSEHRPFVMNGKGGEQTLVVVCSISLLLETASGQREWISRSDGSGETDVEGTKGAFSKAFVRAASSWGVGRFLYAMGSPKVKIVQFGRTSTIDRSEEPRLSAIVRRVCEEYAANPMMRPLVHEEDAEAMPSELASRSPRPIGADAPSSNDLERAALMAAILNAQTLSDGIAALTAARKSKVVDALEAEKGFGSFMLRKIQTARDVKRLDWLADIENGLARAGIGAAPNKLCRDALADAKRFAGAR